MLGRLLVPGHAFTVFATVDAYDAYDAYDASYDVYDVPNERLRSGTDHPDVLCDPVFRI